jgi:hypothetical protein
MNLDDVAGEVQDALKSIGGLRVPEWGVDRVVPPTAIVTLPERIEYDHTKMRGFDRYVDLQVIILLARGNTRTTRAELAEFVAGSGPRSVKAVLDGWTYTSLDTMRVISAEPQVVTFADVPYEAMIFHTDITGRGAAA